MTLKDKIDSVPPSSGVYLMKDKNGQVIYVGKAVSLIKRVKSYFRRKLDTYKTGLLVAEIADIECIVTASEAEALILEASLIQQYHPKFNIELRDDKSYPYIHVSSEEYPRISVVRPAIDKKNLGGEALPLDENPRRRSDRKKTAREPGQYYGPYVNPKLIREALAIIRKIFHFRTCQPFPHKACLDFHIGLCDAPCIQNISKKEYAKNIRNVRWILEGKKDTLYNSLKNEMNTLAREKEFEEAAKLRDQIRVIGALYSGTRDINYYKEAEQLQRALDLPRLPERIEAFDISNLMGDQAVGSMVTFLNGKPDKSNYRRFRIRDVKGIDDFRMIAQIVGRRYRRVKEEGLIFPDLIVIDGGKGQLSAAMAELEKLELVIPVISIAKRQEEIYLPARRNPVILSHDSLGLKLIQRVRDEAHRFAVSYHRTLRGKDIFSAEHQTVLIK